MSKRKPHTFSKEEMAKYNAVGDPEYRHLSCHAPWRSLYFGIQGALVCVATIQKIYWGTMVKASILDLWRGEKAQSIRREFQQSSNGEGVVAAPNLYKQNNVEGLLAKIR